jgi:hypothetical protein
MVTTKELLIITGGIVFAIIGAFVFHQPGTLKDAPLVAKEKEQKPNDDVL